MSHFSGIRLEVVDEASWKQMIKELSPLAADDSAGTTQHRLWRDPSGAAMAFHLSADGGLDCVTPFFFAKDPALWRVQTSGPADDSECAHCGGADCDLLDDQGEMLTRASVQWQRFQPDRAKMPFTTDLEVVTFAHALSFFADEKAFEAGQEAIWPAKPGEKPTRMAAESFFPTGMFGPAGNMGERAVALFCGKLESAQPLTNAHSHKPFLQARVKSLVTVDVVADQYEGEPTPGAFVICEGWLVGRAR
jgi:hypothetical protein